MFLLATSSTTTSTSSTSTSTSTSASTTIAFDITPYIQNITTQYQNLIVIYDTVLPEVSNLDHNPCYDSIFLSVNSAITAVESLLPTMPMMDQATAQLTVDEITNLHNAIQSSLSDCNMVAMTTTTSKLRKFS